MSNVKVKRDQVRKVLEYASKGLSENLRPKPPVAEPKASPEAPKDEVDTGDLESLEALLK